VPIDRFDSVIEKTSCPVMIKIDVEGFETEVILGMQETLANPTLKCLIVELNGSGKRYGFDDEHTHNVLHTAGFNSFSYDPFERRIAPLDNFGCHNTIYIRDFEYCNSRLQSAPYVNVFSQQF
jgi:hypothetical protein